MPIDKSISNLVINKIPTQEIYNRLKEQDLINEDELYLVEEDTGSGGIITYDVATPTSNGLMSAIDKAKLDEIEAQANKYVHPSYTSKSKGFYKVTVDAQGHISSTTTVTKTDITSLGIPAQDTTYTAATTSADGLMSKTDKAKLDGISKPKVASVTLSASSWTNNGDETFSQTVTISNGTSNSKVELQPDSTAIIQLINDGVASMRIDNNSGTFTAVAIKAKPTVNLTIQITLMEVE